MVCEREGWSCSLSSDVGYDTNGFYERRTMSAYFALEDARCDWNAGSHMLLLVVVRLLYLDQKHASWPAQGIEDVLVHVLGSTRLSNFAFDEACGEQIGGKKRCLSQQPYGLQLLAVGHSLAIQHHQ